MCVRTSPLSQFLRVFSRCHVDRIMTRRRESQESCCFSWTILLCFFSISLAAPLSKSSDSGNGTDKLQFFDELNQHHYAEYMKEVFKELESDKNFKGKVEITNATVSLSQYMQLLHHLSPETRTKLDEIKRREVERLNHFESELRQLTQDQNDIEDDKDGASSNLSPRVSLENIIKDHKDHVHNHGQPGFSVDDLRALVTKIQKDIETTDQVREREYRRHEMKKARERRRELKKIKDPELRRKVEKEYRQARRKFLTHKKIHEPGSQQQLKEVWSDQDHLDLKDFDPKTLFNLHDMNQDGHWDINEVEAIIQTDIDKVYKPNNTFVDNDEKFHESMRMRKHMMDKMDANKDLLVSQEEFLNYSRSTMFSRDKEWKTMEEYEEPNFTDEDLKKFEMELESIRNDHKVVDVHPVPENATNI